MSAFDPAELARLAEAATPGKWFASDGGSVYGPEFEMVNDYGDWCVEWKRADAEFVAYCGAHRDAIVEAVNQSMGWEPTKWFRCLRSDGSLWCESSDEEEVRAQAALMGYAVERLWQGKQLREWRSENK